MDYSGNFSDIKHLHRQAVDIIDQINLHSEKIRRGQVKCHLPECRHCELPSGNFKRHEARRRRFYVPVEQIIQVVFGWLIRWKYRGCEKTLTDYPEFALPHKRYTLPMIAAYSHQYVNDDQTTYRGLIGKMPVGYPDSEKQMDHCTIHRWISTLGGYCGIVRKAQDLIVQHDPGSSICRQLANLSVHPAKYRSTRRKGLLMQCRQLLKLEDLYRFAFGVSIFPNLATRCGFS